MVYDNACFTWSNMELWALESGGIPILYPFVYITMLLLREAFWLLILHSGTPEPPQRHLCS